MSDRRYRIDIRSGLRPLAASDDFHFMEEGITFLFGESGIGKSMLSKAVYGLLPPDELEITVNDRPYHDHLRDEWTIRVQQNSFFVFQEPSSHLNPLMKLTDQLNEGSIRGEDRALLRSLWQTDDDECVRKIIDIFPKPYRPSGGEKQRLLLAMAFKKINSFIKQENDHPPSFFVFDEPTGNLDDHYRNLFLELLLEKYRVRPFTILIITHDYSIISEVYRKHKGLLNRINFKELLRKKTGDLAVRDFSADDYLLWLEKSTRERDAVPFIETGKVTLEVASHAVIFNRPLGIFMDPERTISIPLKIRAGEMVYLKAPSGVGKTTLAKAIMGLYPAQKIEARIGNCAITASTERWVWQRELWGRKAGMVFQHADEALNLQATVQETFTGLPEKFSDNEIKDKMRLLFSDSNIDAIFNKKVTFLSGGQKQRLNLLRVLMLAPELVILDEPLNGLDFESIKNVLALLEEQRRLGCALLMISHNEEIFDALIGKEHVYYLAQPRFSV